MDLKESIIIVGLYLVAGILIFGGSFWITTNTVKDNATEQWEFCHTNPSQSCYEQYDIQPIEQDNKENYVNRQMNSSYPFKALLWYAVGFGLLLGAISTLNRY